MKKVRLHHILKAFVILSVLAFFQYYRSNFDPSKFGLIVGVLVGLMLCFLVVYEVYFGDDVFVRKSGYKNEKKWRFVFLLCINFLCFYIFGVYGVSNFSNKIFGVEAVEFHQGKLIGERGARRSSCKHSFLLLNSREVVCLKSNEYKFLEAVLVGDLSKPIEVKLVYKSSLLGKDFIKLEL